MLTLIKSIHTAIWLVMAGSSFYIFYSGLTNRFDIWLYISLALLVLESLILLINRWTCPLTPIARKYSSDQSDNFDIYLPEWLVKYNKLIFGAIFMTGLVLVIFNALHN